MEAGELAVYMLFACAFATLLQHPASPVSHLIASAPLRRVLYGLAMGAAIMAIIMWPWGKQSGGRFNPAITFTFYRQAKVGSWDVLFYSAGHFLARLSVSRSPRSCCGEPPSDPALRYRVTMPGVDGSAVAFIVELAISLVLMAAVLFVSNFSNLVRYTPYVGAMVAT